jgi:hypothetical protein
MLANTRYLASVLDRDTVDSFLELNDIKLDPRKKKLTLEVVEPPSSVCGWWSNHPSWFSGVARLWVVFGPPQFIYLFSVFYI